MSRYLENKEGLLDRPTQKSLGRIQKLQDSDPRFLSILNIESDDEQGEPVTVYIQLAPDNVALQLQPSSKYVPYVVGRVEWGNGGYRTQADIDIADGVSFTVACASLRVTVGPDAQYFTGVPFFETPIAIGAHVSYGVRPSGGLGPTRTIKVPVGSGGTTIAPAATSLIFRIPDFARSFYVVTNPEIVPIDPDLVEVISGVGTIYERILSNAPGVPIPISNDAGYFRITNNGAAPKQYRAIFQLAL